MSRSVLETPERKGKKKKEITDRNSPEDKCVGRKQRTIAPELANGGIYQRLTSKLSIGDQQPIGAHGNFETRFNICGRDAERLKKKVKVGKN
jgi:hypothetical protein